MSNSSQAAAADLGAVRRRPLVAWSLAASASLMFLIVIAVVVSGAATADAATYSWATATTGTLNWTNTSEWTGGTPGTYPGQSSADTVNLPSNAGMTIQINSAIPFPVTLNVPASPGVTIDVLSGGSITLAAGTSVSSTSKLRLSGGTITNSATPLVIGPGATFQFSGGTLTGTGTLQLQSLSVGTFDGANGPMNFAGGTIDNSSTITLSSASNALNIDNGAIINVNAGAALTLSNDAPISTSTTGIINLLGGAGPGTLQKTGGSSTSVTATVNNTAGKVTSGGFTLKLLGGGTHTSSFDNITSGGKIYFGSGATPHVFNTGSTVTATGSYELNGGTMTVNNAAASALSFSSFTQSGGVLNGTGEIDIASFTWQGGTQTGAGTTKVTSSGTANSGAVTLTGNRSFITNGTFTYATTTGSLDISSQAVLTNNGTFDLQSDFTITSDQVVGTSFANNGTLQKTVGSATLINVPFASGLTSTIQPAGTPASKISLGGGGSIKGTFSLGTTNAVLDFSAGTFTFNGMSITGGSAGIVSLSGTAVAQLAASQTFFNFQMNGTPTLQASSANLTIGSSGIFKFDGGTLDALGGSGFVSIGSTASLSFSGGTQTTITNKFKIVNTGTVTYAPSASLNINNGAQFNHNGGTFTYGASTAILSNATSSPTFSVAAPFNVSANVTAQIDALFNQTASVVTLGGNASLRLNGGGTSGGSWATTSSADAFITMGTSTYFTTTGAVQTGPGRVKVALGGTLSVGGSSFAVTNFELNAGSTLTGSANLQISNTFFWNGGTMTGSGHTQMASGSQIDTSSQAGTLTLTNGRTLDNDGTWAWAGAFPISLLNGGSPATINNTANGIWMFTGNNSITVSGAGNAITNSGQINKVSGAGTVDIAAAMTNSGSITVSTASGTIALNGGGSMTSGTLSTTVSTASIDFNGAAQTFTVSGGSFGGVGSINVRNGTLALNANLFAPSTIGVAGGTLTGTGNLTFNPTSTLKWTGGTIAGSGALTIAGSAFLTIDTTSNPVTLDTRTLTLNTSANGTWLGGNTFTMQNGAQIANAGTFDIQGNNNNLSAGTGGGNFYNTGTLRKSTSSGNTVISIDLTNTGSVDLQTGNLAFAGTAPVTHSASGWNLASGTTLGFAAGNHTFTGAIAISGAGTWKLAGATLFFNNSTTVTIPVLTVASGTFSGSADVVITGSLTWDGGTITTNATGLLTVNAPANFATGPLTLGRNTTLNGATTLATISNPLTVQSGVTLANTSTFTIQNGDINCVCVPAPQFNNTGTITRGGFSGLYHIAFPVTGSGNVVVNLGNLWFQGDAALNNVTLNSGGVQFSGNTVTIASATSSATSLFYVTGGTTTVTGPFMLGTTGNIQVDGGTLALSGATDTATFLTLNGGTLSTSGSLTLANGGTWNGGTISGGGTIGNSGTFSILGGNGPMTLTGSTLRNTATVDYIPPSATNILTLQSGSIVNTSGTFSIKAPFDLASSGASTIQNNSGATFRRNAGAAGTMNIGAPVTNAGTMSWSVGTTNFTSTFTQSAAAQTTMNGGNLGFSLPVTFAGSLTAFGTITAPSVTNNGNFVIQSGTNPASLAITGNYAQTSAGVLNVKLNGTTPGTSYDQLAVGGQLTTDGTLNVTLVGPYVPPNGATYDVVTFATKNPVPADFATKNIAPIPGGGTWSAAYGPSALTLTATSAAADISVTQTIAPTVAHTASTNVTVTVTNLGPNSATGVTLDESFTNATYNSYSTATATCTGTGPFHCTFASPLASGGSATITFNVSAGAPGTITAAASVGATSFDSNTTNNTSTVSATVTPASDFGVLSVTDSVDPVLAGGAVSYAVVVKNHGPDTGDATLTLTLSGGAILTTSGLACGAPSGSNVTCTITALASGSTASVTLNATAGGGPSMSLAATIAAAATTTDLNSANDANTQSTTVTAQSDIGITKTLTGSLVAGQQANYTITVHNFGPSDAANVVVNDPLPTRLTFVSATGACSTFPCTIASLTNGQVATITATYTVQPGPQATITNTATVTLASDPNSANNTASASAMTGCPVTPGNLLPGSGASVGTSGVLSWSNAGAATYNVYLGPAGTGCQTLLGTTSSTSMPYANLTANAAYEWRVEAVSSSCATKSSACQTFTTGTVNTCPTAGPQLLAPLAGSVLSSPIVFQWTAVPGATLYHVFASVGGASTLEIGQTADTTFTATLGDGTAVWSVTADVANCSPVSSATATFNLCNKGVPLAAVIAEATTGQLYNVVWDAVAGATKYEIDEATNQNFTNATTKTVTTTSVQFTHAGVQSPQAFFYRVRAFASCGQQFGEYSPTVRVVVVPLPSSKTPNPNINVPAGSNTAVVQQVFVPGFADGAVPFTATTDQPWLTVTPGSGILPPSGTTLNVTANPTGLPNGTVTGTIILTFGVNGASKLASQANGINLPFSVSLVTPVAPAPAVSTVPPNALIIPSVGHLGGINSQWQSDIRLTNTTGTKAKYQLAFSPSGTADTTKKQTTIDVDANATTALDDIVRNWYGVGSLGESANGVLEIRPLDQPARAIVGNATTTPLFATVASSRTYNTTTGGTLGQYIPAIPFASFIGKAAGNAAAPILSLQQVAQSDAFRTNIGLVEASGKPATVLMSVFSSGGAKLGDFSLDLAAGEQKQLNGFLAANGITSLADGRIEVKVTNGDGRITAYASVVDNATNDPLLVSGVQLGTSSATRYVLPGVADINNGIASWRTDARLFNAGTVPQSATLTFYPQNNSGTPVSNAIVINPGEVRTLDNILQSFFGLASNANLGGAVHVTTPASSNLVVTGRTYNKTSTGTFGQFVPAVTEADAVGSGDRALQILQVEDSARYRTNLGIAEVSGKPAVVEVGVNLPDLRVTPTISFTLQPNEFRQFGVIGEFGLGNTYNARVTVKVVGGEGRVTAYGSVIDRQTQDPTYVPAQ